MTGLTYRAAPCVSLRKAKAYISLAAIVLVGTHASGGEGVGIVPRIARLVGFVAVVGPHQAVVLGGKNFDSAIGVIGPLDEFVEALSGVRNAVREVAVVPEGVGRFVVCNHRNKVPPKQQSVKR